MNELTREEQTEADAIAAIARRAEERAEQRAIEKALEQRKRQRDLQFPTTTTSTTTNTNTSSNHKIMFVSKQTRQKQQKSPPIVTNNEERKNKKKKMIHGTTESSHSHSTSTRMQDSTRSTIMSHTRHTTSSNNDLKSQKKKKKKKMKKSMFQFEWDASDDTTTMGQQPSQEQDYLYGPLPTTTKTKTKTTRDAMMEDGNDDDDEYLTNHNKKKKEMTSRDWRIFRENYNIMVRGGNVPPPLRTFDDVSLHTNLTHAIQHVCGYKVPSPIQRQAIPIGLQQRDILGIAETGSGKTAAFGIPLCQMVLTKTSTSLVVDVAENGPLGLVLAPTRELALQIHAELVKLLSTSDTIESTCVLYGLSTHDTCTFNGVKLLSTSDTIESTCVVGGQSIQEQAMKLRQGVHIVVGTPGRLNDCLDMRYLVLNQCDFIVLDEADRMIDLGFAPQMTSILDSISSTSGRVVTAMFSATMPPQVEKLAQEYLHQPIIVSIGGHYMDGDSKNVRIQQRIQYLSNPQQKERALQNLISQSQRDKILVFVNEKKHAEGVGRMIEKSSSSRVVILHGGKTQEQRMDALHAFKQYENVIMVATDVAGRGLDIPNVTHVINYNVPSRSIDAYCHRIGRTGRAGKHGLATSLVTDEDESILPALVSYLQQTNMPIPHRLLHHPSILQNNNHNF